MIFLVPPKTDDLKNFLNGITDFCLARRGARCFKGWDRAKLFRYVAFNHFTGRLLVCFENNAPTAIIVCWPDTIERLEAKAENRHPVFDWEYQRQNGDCIFVAEVIGDQSSVRKIYEVALNSAPHLITTPILTFRRGKLVRLRGRTLARFVQ